jgi:hypothetical protein
MMLLKQASLGILSILFLATLNIAQEEAPRNSDSSAPAKAVRNIVPVSFQSEQAQTAAQKFQSHEEQVVRATYGKAGFAAQIGMVWHAVIGDKEWPGLNDGLTLSKAMNEQIRFELNGFKTGKVADISSESWTTLLEGPVNVLSLHYVEIPVGFSKGKLQTNYNLTYADAAWLPESPSPSETHEERAPSALVPTVKHLLQSLRKPRNGVEWTRYVSYSVVAMLRERSISYRASFLFSGQGDQEEILALDYATGMSIAPFANNPMYPSALLDTVYREIPFVQGWIVANEIDGCKQFKRPEVCCDRRTGRCGLATEDVQQSLSTAIDPETRLFISTYQPNDEKKPKKERKP